MRKHSTWLWSIIIVVVIFAFVIWGTNPGSGQGGPVGSWGEILGHRITEEEFVAARQVVELGYFLRFGQRPGAEAEQAGFNEQQEIYVLLLRMRLLKDYDMYAGPEAKAAAITEMLKQFQAQGAGINTLDDFVKRFLEPNGFTIEDLDRFFEHRLASRQLERVVGLSGRLASPLLIESIWDQENRELSAEAVFFSSSNYVDSVTVTPEALRTYYTNQMPRYLDPEKRQVSYVAFPISNYLAKADERLSKITNLTAEVDAEYERRGEDAFPDLTPEAAKAQIREEMRKVAAASLANHEATVFASELWRKDPMRPADLETEAEQEGLTVKVSSAFSESATPEELQVGMDFTQAAYALRDDEPHGGPIVGEENVYVITLNKLLPRTNLPFEQVKDRVESDYRQREAILQAQEQGRSFEEQLTNSLAADKSFSQACRDAGLEPVTLDPFSRRTTTMPEVERHTSAALFKQVAFSTPVGEASPFIPSGSGGFIVFIGSELDPDPSLKEEQLPEFSEFVRRNFENEAFSQWFSREATRGLTNTPLFRTPPSQLSSSDG